MVPRGAFFFPKQYDFANYVFANNNDNKSLQFFAENVGGLKHSNLPLILILKILAALSMNVSNYLNYLQRLLSAICRVFSDSFTFIKIMFNGLKSSA